MLKLYISYQVLRLHIALNVLSCNNHLKQLYISSKSEHFSYKGGCGVMHIMVFKIRAVFGYIQTALGY